MKLTNGIDERQIKEVIEEHPEIGVILDRYGIGCTKCGIGTCLVRDVVAVHVLGEAVEQEIEEAINTYLSRARLS